MTNSCKEDELNFFQFVLHVADAAVRRGAGENLHGFFGWLQKGLGCLGYSRAYSPATAEAVEIPKAKTAASKKEGHDEEEASEGRQPRNEENSLTMRGTLQE